MKLTTKNLLIILTVLSVVFVVSQFTKRTGRSRSLKSELVSIDTAKVSKVEITSDEGFVMLAETETGWTVLLPNGNEKGAKKSSVVSLLNTLNSITPGRLAAKNPDRWSDYAVDSTGTRVKVYERNDIVTDIVIGRFGMEGQQRFYSFVRLFEDDEVYVADGFMGMSIGKDADAYRENSILKLQKDSLTSITFDYPDSAFTLTKGERWYLKDQEADSASMIKYLNGLRSISSSNFYDQEVPSELSHTITFSFVNQTEVRIEGYTIEEGLVIKSSENSDEFFLDASIRKKLFKGRSAFMTTSN